MKLPIIINENGDISFYKTVQETELYLEAIDVNNDEYEAYDSDALLLNLDVEVRGEPSVDHVIISENKHSMKDVEKLREVLVVFLTQLNVSVSPDIALESLIEKCIDKAGYTN